MSQEAAGAPAELEREFEMSGYRDHDLNASPYEGQCPAEGEGFVLQEDIEAPILRCILKSGHVGSHVHPNLIWSQEKLQCIN